MKVARKLVDSTIDEVSLVDHPANKRERFLVVKQAPTVDELHAMLKTEPETTQGSSSPEAEEIEIDENALFAELEKLGEAELDDDIAAAVDVLTEFIKMPGMGKKPRKKTAPEESEVDKNDAALRRVAEMLHPFTVERHEQEVAKQIEEVYERFIGNLEHGLDPNVALSQYQEDIKKLDIELPAETVA